MKRFRIRITAALSGALCMGATGCAVRGDDDSHREAEPPIASTTTVPPPAPVTGALLGASTSPETRGLASEKAAVEELEQRLGRTLDINHNFYGWDEPFPTDVERWDLLAGRIPMIS